MRKIKLFSLTALILSALIAFAACGAESASKDMPNETTAPEEATKTRTLLACHTIEQYAGGMDIQFRYEYTYDEQGLMTGFVTYSGDEEVSRSTVTERDEWGNGIRQTEVSGEVTTVTESQITYGENGIMLAKTDTETVDGTVTATREYTYNADGKVLSMRYIRSGDSGFSTSNTYEYDENGNTIVEIQESNGAAARSEKEYDENNRVVKTVHTNSGGETTTYCEYSYDENGVQKQTVLDSEGNEISYSLTTYNEHGNPLLIEYYTGDTLTMRMTYTYITVPAFN